MPKLVPTTYWLRGLALALLLASSGCAVFRPASLADLALPSPSQLKCCWQAQESVQIELPDQQLQVQAALLLRDNSLTVVLFDPLGRRLVTLQQDSNGLQTLSAPEQWDERLSKQLLLAIYLHQLPANQWHIQQAGWQLQHSPQRRTLAYRGDVRMQLDYLEPNSSDTAPRRVTTQRPKLNLSITTLARTDL